MVADMTNAAALGAPVRGVKGPSPMLNLPGFNIAWSFSPDYMHCVLLGVTRQITELWFSSTGTDYYIGAPSYMRTVDDRLRNLKPPRLFTRLPRSLSTRKYWKGAEWEHWLLYYSLPCLRNVLPNEYYVHYSLLVCGVYNLIKGEISLNGINNSTDNLTEFVVQTEVLYGRGQMTSNMHTLLHLPKAALLLGPLWAHSCFTFENNMGKLLKHVKSSKGVTIQILSRVLFQTSIGSLKSMASPSVADIFHQERTTVSDSPSALGRGQPPDSALKSFVERHIEHCKDIVEYTRMSVKKHTFHSVKYTLPVKTDSTALKQGDLYTRIENIISVAGRDDSKKMYIMFLHGKMFLLQRPPTKLPRKSSTEVELTVPDSILGERTEPFME
ncbi:uncharacterized protein LOC135373003 [Ornithodoros turicata]|uniref:uncharacterized protein LOC135373003 n=1 Tax=Ornithodoros turicata TaxID=34597 RepID=UPI003139AFE7